MLRKIGRIILITLKWCVFAVGFVVIAATLIILVQDKYWRITHCKENGLMRDDALGFAVKRIDSYKKTAPHTPAFEVINEGFDEDSKDWFFEFRSKDCIIIVYVDECGNQDIGGLTFGCLSLNDKLRVLEDRPREHLMEELERLETGQYSKYSDKEWIGRIKDRIEQLDRQAIRNATVIEPDKKIQH